MVMCNLGSALGMLQHFWQRVEGKADRTDAHRRAVAPTLVRFTPALAGPLKETTAVPAFDRPGSSRESGDVRAAMQQTVRDRYREYRVIVSGRTNQRAKVLPLRSSAFMDRANDVAGNRTSMRRNRLTGFVRKDPSPATNTNTDISLIATQGRARTSALQTGQISPSFNGFAGVVALVAVVVAGAAGTGYANCTGSGCGRGLCRGLTRQRLELRQRDATESSLGLCLDQRDDSNCCRFVMGPSGCEKST